MFGSLAPPWSLGPSAAARSPFWLARLVPRLCPAPGGSCGSLPCACGPLASRRLLVCCFFAPVGGRACWPAVLGGPSSPLALRAPRWSSGPSVWPWSRSVWPLLPSWCLSWWVRVSPWSALPVRALSGPRAVGSLGPALPVSTQMRDVALACLLPAACGREGTKICRDIEPRCGEYSIEVQEVMILSQPFLGCGVRSWAGWAHSAAPRLLACLAGSL